MDHQKLEYFRQKDNAMSYLAILYVCVGIEVVYRSVR